MVDRDKRATVDLKVRMKESLRAQIESAALNHGISMNAEAVARLEQTFRDEGLLPEILDLAYGRETAGLLILLAETVRHVGASSIFLARGGEPQTVDDAARLLTREWVSDPWAFQQVKTAVFIIFAALQPAGTDEAAPPATVAAMPGEIPGSMAHQGRYWASLFLNSLLALPDSNIRAVALLNEVRARIPEAIERLRARP